MTQPAYTLIPLSRNKISLVDNEDAHLSNFKWYCCSKGYAVRHAQLINGLRPLIFLHHAIIGFPLFGKQVDHINGNSLDNRRGNLRIVSVSQNQQNRKSHRMGRLLGTTKRIYKTKGRIREYWQAQILVNGKSKKLGCYPSAILAHEVYKKARRRMSGEL